jgi:arylsulfatase A-like enzyme
LLIVTDDLGWADLNCYGNPLVKSPHLDELARRGVQFMQAYAAAPVGAPSRAALQTGIYPARTDNGKLTARYETLGELARHAGLITAHIGKWPLGTGEQAPGTRGYDHVFATAAIHPDDYYHPFFTENPLPDLLAETKPGDYLTDKLTDHALDLIDGWRDTTWLISLNYYAPHVPLRAREDQVTAYRQLIDSTHWRKFPTLEYAAMISTLDENIGRIMAALEASGQLDNTLIIFTSDNGGLHLPAIGKLYPHTPPTDNGILRGGKGTLYEGGIRVPFIVHFPAYATTRAASLEPVIGTDVFPTVAEALGQDYRAQNPDGRSLLPLLHGEHMRERTLFWSSPYDGPEGPATAVRHGDLKLYRDDGRDSLTWFNLRQFPDESLMTTERGTLLEALRGWAGGVRN